MYDKNRELLSWLQDRLAEQEALESQQQLDRDCPICHDPGVALRLPCGHSYHEKCFKRWNGSCPECRRDDRNMISLPQMFDQHRDLQRELAKKEFFGFVYYEGQEYWASDVQFDQFGEVSLMITENIERDQQQRLPDRRVGISQLYVTPDLIERIRIANL